MPTVKPILRTEKRSQDGRAPVWLRILEGKKQRFVSLGVKVPPKHWNARQGRVRKTHPDADLLNELLAERVRAAEREMLRQMIDGAPPTADSLKAALKPLKADAPADFFAFAEGHLADLEQRGNIARLRRLKATLGLFATFAGTPLPFEGITPRLLTDFETARLAAGAKQSTVGTNLRDLRALFNRAIAEGLAEENPFRRLRIKAGHAAERDKLTRDELDRLAALALPPDSLLCHVRDFFLCQVYFAGVRFGDLAQLTGDRIEADADGQPVRLRFRAGKTGKVQSVMIPAPARRIIAPYLRDKSPSDFLFPFLEDRDVSTPTALYTAVASANTVANRYLKTLAERAGIGKRVSTHIARHTFADLARTEGWSTYDVRNALQHSSVAITETYLAGFDGNALDERLGSLFQ